MKPSNSQSLQTSTLSLIACGLFLACLALVSRSLSRDSASDVEHIYYRLGIAMQRIFNVENSSSTSASAESN